MGTVILKNLSSPSGPSMSTVTRSGCHSRPPANRDQATIPLVHRRADEGSAGASYMPSTMAVGNLDPPITSNNAGEANASTPNASSTVDPAITSIAQPTNAGEANASTANANLNSTSNAPLEPSR